MKKNNSYMFVIIVLIAIFFLFLLLNEDNQNNLSGFNKETEKTIFSSIPQYDNKEFVYIKNNKPDFNNNDYLLEQFESYSELDSLGRCGVAYANIGKELMPTEKRGSISKVKPTGWHTIKYDIVNGKYLYNRCHLIGFQLTGENANEKNLITCTHQMNTSVMTEFENQVAQYIRETNNHVLYRVTPIFEGNNLVSTGVQIEASSVEDRCDDICFNVFIYNVQDGISIDYLTGNSKLK